MKDSDEFTITLRLVAPCEVVADRPGHMQMVSAAVQGVVTTTDMQGVLVCSDPSLGSRVIDWFVTFLAVAVGAMVAGRQMRAGERRTREDERLKRLQQECDSVTHVRGTLQRLIPNLRTIIERIEAGDDPLQLPSTAQIDPLKADVYSSLRAAGQDAEPFETTMTAVELSAVLVTRYLIGVNDPTLRNETYRRLKPALLELLRGTVNRAAEAVESLTRTQSFLAAQIKGAAQ